MSANSRENGGNREGLNVLVSFSACERGVPQDGELSQPRIDQRSGGAILGSNRVTITESAGGSGLTPPTVRLSSVKISSEDVGPGSSHNDSWG